MKNRFLIRSLAVLLIFCTGVLQCSAAAAAGYTGRTYRPIAANTREMADVTADKRNDWAVADGVLTIRSATGMEQWKRLADEDRRTYAKMVGEIRIESGVTVIPPAAFKGFGALKRVSFPEGLQYIEQAAFWRCTELETAHFPDSLLRIGDDAFRYCENLREVILPDALTALGEGAFAGCSRLYSVKLSAGLTALPALAFFDAGMAVISVPANVQTFGEGAFGGVFLNRLIIGAEAPSLDPFLLAHCPNLEQLVFLGDVPADYGSLFYAPVAAPTVYYLTAYREKWHALAVLGWNDLQFAELPSPERLPALKQTPVSYETLLERFGWRRADDPGTASTACRYEIATDDGWRDLCRVSRGAYDLSGETLFVAEGVTAMPPEDRWKTRFHFDLLSIPSTLQRIGFIEGDRIGRIELSLENPYFRMQGDTLIETATGEQLWPVPRSPLGLPSPTPHPVPATSLSLTAAPFAADTPALMASPEAETQASRVPDWAMIGLLAGIALTGTAAALAAGWRSRRRRARRYHD